MTNHLRLKTYNVQQISAGEAIKRAKAIIDIAEAAIQNAKDAGYSEEFAPAIATVNWPSPEELPPC